ncbi:MAG TPA: prolyl oligopeptidase family serine peptidase [Vicinamibacteria bacterium]|nr:prolyl oligopeptidase family serine peptidase [Vicinamibacteria bacterium]
MRHRIALLCAIWLVLTPLVSVAQELDPGYVLPPESVQDLFRRDKNFTTLSQLGPDGDHFLVTLSSELSTLEKMGQDTLRLAMLELRPDVNREWNLDTHGIYGLRVFSLSERRFRDIDLPAGILVSDMMWSPDGSELAFLAHLSDRTEVWIADVRTGTARSVSSAPVMATLAAGPAQRRPSEAPSGMLQWTPEGSLLTLLVPEQRGDVPRSGLPSGPIVHTTRDKETPNPTYPFLLRDRGDAERFRYHTTSQLAELMPGQAPRWIGRPGMFLEFSLSPDGKHILAERIVEPLSHLVSFTEFARNLEVMDRDGNVLSTIREMPIREGRERGPDRIEQKLPREVRWRPDGKGLAFLWQEEGEEEENDGNEEEATKSDKADRLMQLEAPFALSSARVLVTSDVSKKETFADVRFSLEGDWAFTLVKSSTNGKSRERVAAFDLNRDPVQEQIIAADYDPEDPVKLPGEVLSKSTPNGLAYALLSTDGRHAYLKGSGYAEDFEPRPFIDRIRIADGSKERLFEGREDVYEQPLVPLDADLTRMTVSRETRTTFPDSFLWSSGAEMVNLTNNRDPFPELTAVERVDFEFTRRDGLVVQGRISLPLGYRAGERVPAIFWTYPSEYSSEKEYRRDAIRDRAHNRHNELSYLRWSDIWLTQGYALIHPDVPIIRKDRTYNDNYVQHLVDSLYAAIRKVDELGYVDIDRIGHGGHSYGAFATANLLAHTPYFKAGIAGDGAYNRTLTPMGFQSERRFLWENPHVYFEMSPFFQADHIDTPLLMYHGLDDNNTGTFPIQSERMMQALTGLGKTAVLYLYPFESHGPRARETYLDLWARWLEWFDTHVKAPGIEQAPPTENQSVAQR